MLERDGDGWTELLQRAESGEEEDRGKNENLPLCVKIKKIISYFFVEIDGQSFSIFV